MTADQRAFAVEAKYQEVQAPRTRRSPTPSKTWKRSGIPGCLVYAGPGWSKGVLHTLEGSRRAVHCLPERPDLGPAPSVCPTSGVTGALAAARMSFSPAHPPGSLDRAEQVSLCGRVGDSRLFEREAGDSQQRERQPQDRGQHRHPPLQLGDALPQGGLATVGLDERDDLPQTAADPAHRRRAGDLQFRVEFRVPRADDLLLDSVVVGAARAMAHVAIGPWSSRPAWSTKPSPKWRAISRSASASRRLHNVRRLSGVDTPNPSAVPLKTTFVISGTTASRA
jgi:hypothetical protein